MIHKKRSLSYAAILLLVVMLIALNALRSPVYAAAPDLTVSSVWLEKASAPGVPVAPAGLAVGDSFNIVASVTNLGQATGNGFYLDVYYDSTYGRGGPDNIASGEVQQWYVGPLTLASGTHTTRWVIDPDNQVSESNEQNNEKDYSFAAGQSTSQSITLTGTVTASNSTIVTTTTVSVTTTSTVTSNSQTQNQTITVTQSQIATTVTNSVTVTPSATQTQSSAQSPQTQTVTVTQSQAPGTVTNSVTVTQAVTQIQTVTQGAPASSTIAQQGTSTTASLPVSTSTPSTTSTTSKQVTSTTSMKTTSSTSTTTSTKAITSTATTVAPGCRGKFCSVVYLLQSQDAASLWISMFLLITGAWLAPRIPRYWTGGLSGISKLNSLRANSATHQASSANGMNSE